MVNEVKPEGALTVQETADEFGVCLETVRRWVRSNRVPALRYGTVFYINREDVKAHLARCKRGNYHLMAPTR